MSQQGQQWHPTKGLPQQGLWQLRQSQARARQAETVAAITRGSQPGTVTAALEHYRVAAVAPRRRAVRGRIERIESSTQRRAGRSTNGSGSNQQLAGRRSGRTCHSFAPNTSTSLARELQAKAMPSIATDRVPHRLGNSSAVRLRSMGEMAAIDAVHLSRSWVSWLEEDPPTRVSQITSQRTLSEVHMCTHRNTIG